MLINLLSQGKGKADRIIHNPVLLALRQHKGGIYGDRVTGMDAGAQYVP